MAKFRDSAIDPANRPRDAADPRIASAIPPLSVGAGTAAGTSANGAVHDRSIGDIIAELRNLTAEQVEKVLEHQQKRGTRFGEAAVALGFASNDDVLFALSQQFHYPYVPLDQRGASSELVALNEPFSPRAEGFRALRSQLMMRLFGLDEPRRALAVVSPDSGDGKTYCAANLGVVLAQLGGRTLLVDADMRGPRMHDVFKIKAQAGLSAILSGRSDNQVIHQVAGVPSLFVLPVGTTPPNPLELVERPAFALLMRELSSKFDYVVVDTPAACNGSDAAVIAARCGAALVVARKDKVRVDSLQDMVANLGATPTRVAGVVMNEY
jgi:chain length determinant protein tyrosine kinase EpsG